MNNNIRDFGYDSAAAITPSDSALVPQINNKGLWVTGAGNVSILFWNSATPVVLTLAANTVYKFHFQKIMATGTTATGIIGLGWV